MSDFATVADADYLIKLLLKYATTATANDVEKEAKIYDTKVSDKKYKVSISY